MLGRILAALLAACSVPEVAIAEDDLPARVGRIADVAGGLHLASDASDWTPIGQNYPVTQGDRLRVTAEGRAEVDFGTGQLRLDGDANVQVTALDEHRFALYVASGRVIVRLRTLEDDDAALVDTPQTRIRLDRPGAYRIEVAADREETEFAVREGEAAMRFDGGVQQVRSGESALIAARDPTRISVVDGVVSEGFDAWSIDRDRSYDGYRSGRYVASEMVGAVDLDTYGTWEDYPTYGGIWFPTIVAVGWAPYRFGRWVWCGPWGWTWVDDAPWGYAPFHYGRWLYIGGRWGWCPGAFTRHPVWAPALVAWFGGSGWTSTSGAPVFGWLPLAWGEPLRPHWRCSERCRRGLNQPVAADGTTESGRHRFASTEAPGALTAVAARVLAEGKPVAVNTVRVFHAGLAFAPALDDTPSIAAAAVAAAFVPAAPLQSGIRAAGHPMMPVAVAPPVPGGPAAR